MFQAKVGSNMKTLHKTWEPDLQLSLSHDFSNGSVVNESQESRKDFESMLSLSLSSSSVRQQEQSSTPTSRIRFSISRTEVFFKRKINILPKLYIGINKQIALKLLMGEVLSTIWPCKLIRHRSEIL